VFKGRAFRAIHPLEEEQGDHKGSTNDELKQRDAQEKGTACPEWNAERETKNAREKREEQKQTKPAVRRVNVQASALSAVASGLALSESLLKGLTGKPRC